MLQIIAICQSSVSVVHVPLSKYYSKITALAVAVATSDSERHLDCEGRDTLSVWTSDSAFSKHRY